MERARIRVRRYAQVKSQKSHFNWRGEVCNGTMRKGMGVTPETQLEWG